jgi:hypothetical protein
MSDKTEKDYIRDTVVAIARGDLEVARESINQVFTSKGARKLAEVDQELEESMHTRSRRNMKRLGKGKARADFGKKRMDEMNDTGSDSGVVSGKHDDDADDITDKKGTVKQSSGIDHDDYEGEPSKVFKGMSGKKKVVEED